MEFHTPETKFSPLTRDPRFPTFEVYRKEEFHLPAGLHKDRIYRNLLTEPDPPPPLFSIGSCGNSGVCAFFYTRQLGIPLHLFLPLSYRPFECRPLFASPPAGLHLHPVEGTYEEAVEKSRQFAAAHPRGRDISTGSPFQLAHRSAYGSMVDEVLKKLPLPPPTVLAWVIPVGDGGTFLEIVRRARTLLPGTPQRFFAVSNQGNNSITESVRTGKKRHQPLAPDSIRPAAGNIPFLNWNATFGDECVAEIDGAQSVVCLTDEEIAKAGECHGTGPVSAVVLEAGQRILAAEGHGARNWALIQILTD